MYPDVTPEQILRERDMVVAEAYSWLNTPYIHLAAVKGVGVDCAQILWRVYPNCLPWLKDSPITMPYYSMDWHLHRSDEMYKEMIETYADQVDTPMRGNVVIFKIGRVYSHGAIIVEWPTVIHALLQCRCVTLDDVNSNKDMEPRPKLFYSPWKRHYGRDT
jgi:cell wall-associated NlpC family hydrolase